MKILAAKITGLRGFVTNFFRKFPQYKQYKTKQPKDFTWIINEFHSDFIDAVIKNRYGADLPLKFGNIRIISYKQNRVYPNLLLFQQKNVKVGFSNNHTNGLNCKIQYRNKGNRYKFKDKIIWAFFPQQSFSKRVSQAFREDYNKYIFSPNRGQIKKKLNEFNWKNISDENIEKFLISYNEFEL